ncbi:hypothetical protein GGS23DRAFT_59703 [Durotheca rogersii]|uniref:uncharacterized protein n=1 Tax=Durotheca rogersii TaxID=419775 RepID=UPI002220BDA0|nr:uncharacterized protein GGS23DRAFT_59703 [Durotheca rogersii]KAI5863231.1 hypothetical protein GGS23DRAFT_59703 [Durotheca rogersii]
MAAANGLSAPGSATYESDTLVVGDGTWDFSKNTFLLPNLQGLNIDTMRYNGMGNRFSTVEQYHQLITVHGVLAVITFLFIIPTAVMYARFRPYGSPIVLHAYLHVLAMLLSTALFILGWFAVGPRRSLTNPHHGIGVAIYTMIMVQIIGGRLVKNIRSKSLRLMLHRWLGRVIAILGIVQVPLGLTLYGSPLYTFILYAVWMAILLLIYFVLSWRQEGERDREDLMIHGGRSEGGVTASESKSGRGMGLLAPLAIGAGLWTWARRRKDRDLDQSQSGTGSQARSRARGPEVVSSRRGSASYFDDEKISERTDRREGGVSNWLFNIAGLLGAGALVKGARDRRERRRYDEEYSAVATDTPSRSTKPAGSRTYRKPITDQYTESEFSDDRTELHDGRRPHTPRNHAATTLLSGTEPMTPRPLRPRPPAGTDYTDYTDYSSYVSPSRRRTVEEEESKSTGKGFLAMLGLGWLAKKAKDGHDEKEDERRRLEEERRDGQRGSKYTGDGYSSPSKSPKKPPRQRPPPSSALTATSYFESESSMLETRPLGTSVSGPPMPPLGAGKAPAAPVPGPSSHSHSRSRSRSKSGAITDPVSMPPMPADPRGILRPHSESDSESYASTGGGLQGLPPSRLRVGAEKSALAAGTNTTGFTADEDERQRRERSQVSSQPVSVKLRYHDDRDRNITLRRLTEEEAVATRRDHRRRSNSVSTLSDSEAPSRRYRRDSSSHRTADEAAAERLVGELSPPSPPSPPTPTMQGRRAGKDSAYYSGQPGPSGTTPMAPPTMSTVTGGAESHGDWGGLSPTPSGPVGAAGSTAPSAADRRRRRRLERRDTRPSDTVDYS